MQIPDVLPDKYQKWLQQKKIKVFKKVFFDNFLQILTKNSLGSIHFIRDGRVTAKQGRIQDKLGPGNGWAPNMGSSQIEKSTRFFKMK